MPIKRTIKKELSRNQLLKVTLEKFKLIDNAAAHTEALSHLEELVKSIATAAFATAWQIDGDKKRLYIDASKHHKAMSLPWDKGLLGRVVSEKKAFYINTVEEAKAFNKSVDNAADDSIKDIIFLPVSNEEGELFLLLEAATSKSDLQQFTDNDLDLLETLLPFLREREWIFKTRAAAAQSTTEIETLRQEKERAEAIMASSTQFLAEVAHEIRTPMNAVMGFIDLLQVDEKNKERLIYLESAAKSGTMMNALINDLLDFTKIEKGMMELEKINFNPVEEFGAMAPLFCARMKKKSILFKLYLDPALPKTVVSDPHRIKQILSNLLGNAIKFTPERGEITLEVLYDTKKSRIDFSVIDTGIGIAKENQSKIFEAYSQETSSTARKFGGTGLGLSISSRLAEKLGDRLHLESELGKGSRFYFSLDVSDAIADSATNFDLKALKKVKPALIFSEDFAPTGVILKRYLTALGIDEQLDSFSSCSEVNQSSYTHLFISQDLIDYPQAQKNLDNGTSITIFKQTAFKYFSEELEGKVNEIECSFGPDRLYDVLLPQEEKKERKDQRKESTAPQHKKKVLVVDDNQLNVHFMREVIKKFDALVESASDGDEALEIYKRVQAWKDPFDLILMDENMPHMNGSEAARIISQLEKENNYPHIPIIGISGDATEEQRLMAIESGMDDCIFKPVSMKKIKEVFEQFTSSER